MATKNPKIIIDQNSYLVLRKEVTKTVWMCTRYFGHRKDRCKSRLITSGRDVYVSGVHNHPNTITAPMKHSVSQMLNIIRVKPLGH